MADPLEALAVDWLVARGATPGQARRAVKIERYQTHDGRPGLALEVGRVCGVDRCYQAGPLYDHSEEEWLLSRLRALGIADPPAPPEPVQLSLWGENSRGL